MNALVLNSVEQDVHDEKWDPYRILGLKRRSAPDKIRAAYRRLAKKLHSDAGGDARAFLMLKEAHDFLMNDIARALWDRKQMRATEQECATARKMLDQICSSIIQGLAASDSIPADRANIPEMIRDVVRANLDDFAQGKRDREAALRRLKRMKGKTRRKGKGDNMVTRILEGQIAQIEAALESFAAQARIGEIMLAELEVYEFDAPPPPAFPDPPETFPRYFTVGLF